MSNPRLRRVEKLEASLTPREAIRLHLREAHEHSCADAYYDALLALPAYARPLPKLRSQVKAAVQQGADLPATQKGESATGPTGPQRDPTQSSPRTSDGPTQPRKHEGPCEAVQQADRDVCQLFVLVEKAEERVDKYLVIAEREARHLKGELKGLLNTAQGAAETAHYIGHRVPYPLDTATAEAVATARQQQVIGLSELIGTQRCQEIAVRLGEEGEAHGVAAVAAHGELAPSVGGEETQADGEETVAPLQASLHKLIEQLTEDGTLQRGRQVGLPSVPIPFLHLVPLLDCTWIAHEAVLLAEWGTLLRDIGFMVDSSLETSPFACQNLVQPQNPLPTDSVTPSGSGAQGGNAESLDLSEGNAALALREEAAAQLSLFSGRRREIEGVVYWHYEDYQSWPQRLAPILKISEPSVLLSSWNTWVREIKSSVEEERSPQLAGLRLLEMVPRSCRFEYRIVPDSIQAAKEQAQRRAVLRQLQSKLLPELLEQSVQEMSSDSSDALFVVAGSYLDQVLTWMQEAQSLLQSLLVLQATATELSQRYLDGAEILFPQSVERLNSLLHTTQIMIQDYSQGIATDIEELISGGIPGAELGEEFGCDREDVVGASRTSFVSARPESDPNRAPVGVAKGVGETEDLKPSGEECREHNVAIPTLERVGQRHTLCISSAALAGAVDVDRRAMVASILRQSKIEALQLTGQGKEARRLEEEELRHQRT